VVQELDVDDIFKITKEVAERVPAVSRELRVELESMGVIGRVDRDSSYISRYKRIFAVDAAFPRYPFDTVSLSFSIVTIARLFYEFESRKLDVGVSKKLLVEYGGEVDQDYVSARARIWEREAILSAIEDVDVVFIDGEIVPKLKPKLRGERDSLWISAVEKSREVLERARSNNVVVAGIIKRSYSKIISKLIGSSTVVNDKAVASAILRRGEYIAIESRDPILSTYKCFDVFYKPFVGLPEAVRVELCCSSSVFCYDFISLLVGESSNSTGLPWFIDLVDSRAKKEVRFVKPLYVRLLALLSVEDKHILGFPSNLQERVPR